ncbi:hypothetical protein [Hyphomicrobium sp. MC1]|uniref:hypothetical protein n=1 Tax=Hyphomicrobium sp. (strain MC1) TaxID=717785 RepID=UPI000213DAA7|nr:hypothetical protein [Hyphomicrobium sp. MC1]CCB64460.1 protein of unknown function [Hyphomicrobium sp. MC1]
MAISNLIHQQTTTTGTGPYTLTSVNGRQTFNNAFGNGSATNRFPVFMQNQAAAEWMHAKGHLSAANTLVIDTVKGGSNGTSAVSFSAGTIDVTSAVPAEHLSSATVNIEAFGAIPDGTTACDTAFAAAYAWLGSSGGVIEFGPGDYLFGSRIAITLPNSRYCLGLKGAGSNLTRLVWSISSGGISLTQGNAHNSFRVEGFSIVTKAANGGTGFEAKGKTQVASEPSLLCDVVFAPDDYAVNTTGSHYWSICIHLQGWGNISFYHCYTYGQWKVPTNSVTSALGQGIRIEGDATMTGSGSGYITIINFFDCSFSYHDYAVVLGDYWQGITFNTCNFNGQIGTSGIFQSGSTSGVLALLCCIGCQFNTGGSQIDLSNAGVNNLVLNGNTIGAYNTSTVGAAIGPGLNATIVGNFFLNYGSNTGIVGASGSGSGHVITGNMFKGLNTGVVAASGSSGWVVGLNKYPSTTTKTVDSGSANSFGTAAAGAMTGVVP